MLLNYLYYVSIFQAIKSGSPIFLLLMSLGGILMCVQVIESNKFYEFLIIDYRSSPIHLIEY